MYGYGGVCSVVVAVLRSLGIKTYCCGRRLEEAAKRASQLGAVVWTPDRRPQLFINAAPITDKPLTDAVNFLEAISGCAIAFDHEMPGTYLKDYCEQHGLVHVSGYEMYWPQMIAQWQLFLEGIVQPDKVEELLRSAEENA